MRAVMVDSGPDVARESVENSNEDADSIDTPGDPDAQTTVTDFLDFTEYLPSDLSRSLTLIGDLDQRHNKAIRKVDKLSTVWAERPGTAPAAEQLTEQGNTTARDKWRQDTDRLREEFAVNASDAVTARTLAHAEAVRMAENTDQHAARLQVIVSKLQGLWDAFPSAQDEAAAAHSSPQAARQPRITLRLGDIVAEKGGHRRIKRGPRITVPGEVLAPQEFDWDTFESESESTAESDEGDIVPPNRRQRAGTGEPTQRIKIRLSTQKRADKVSTGQATVPKTPRIRPPGFLGTNVHSQVAGISTSNAIALIKPPPDDAPVGSEHRPWGLLTAWELANLRKRMKKNAVWKPSSTMVSRELETLQRTQADYQAAKAAAEADGREFTDVWKPVLKKQMVGGNAFAALDVEAAIEAENLQNAERGEANVERGLPSNEPRTAKKGGLTQLAPEETEAALARKLSAIQQLFPPSQKNTRAADTLVSKTPAKTPIGKRKRDSTAETSASKLEVEEPSTERRTSAPILPGSQPPAKRAKQNTSIAQTPSAASRLRPPTSATLTRSADSHDESPAAEGNSSSSSSLLTPGNGAPALVRKSSTPILPPGRGRRTINLNNQPATPAPARPVSPPAPIAAAPKDTPAPPTTRSTRQSQLPPPPKHEDSSRAASKTAVAPKPAKERPPSRSKGSSSEPPASVLSDRPRRTPKAPTPAPVATLAPEPERPTSRRGKNAATAATPVPETEARPTSRRGKKATPTPVNAQKLAETAKPIKLTLTKRPPITPKLKAAKAKYPKYASMMDNPELDAEEAVALPTDERFCLCNRVNFGEMIECDNAPRCPHGWFHLGCVGLTPETLPGRTSKWYCPVCREKLGVGGNGIVGGRKR